MTEPKQFDVFLCHNSNDKNIIRLIAQKLENHGIRVWFDEKKFIPGDIWKSKLYEMLDEINTVVFFFGRHGVGPWQDAEINYLHNRYINNKRQSPRIIPILLGKASINNLPPELNYLKEIQFMNLHNLDNYSEISKLIQVIFRRQEEEYSNSEQKNKIEDQNKIENDNTNQFIGFFETPNVQEKRKDKVDKDIKLYNKKLDNLIKTFEQIIDYTNDAVDPEIKNVFEKNKKEYEQSKSRIAETLKKFEKESNLIEKQLTLLLNPTQIKMVPPPLPSSSLYWWMPAIIGSLIAVFSLVSLVLNDFLNQQSEQFALKERTSTSYLTKPELTKYKIVTEPPLCQLSPEDPILQNRAVQVIQTYLETKKEMFAPPYDRKNLAEITTNEFYEKANDTTNWLQHNRAYYHYNIQKIDGVKEFLSEDDKVKIKVKIIEDYTLYNIDGSIDISASNFKAFTVIYSMTLTNGRLKISNSKVI